MFLRGTRSIEVGPSPNEALRTDGQAWALTGQLQSLLTRNPQGSVVAVIVRPLEHEALRRCRTGRCGSVERLECVTHVHGRTAPPPDLDEHADQTPDHLMGEGVRSNLELDRGAGLAPARSTVRTNVSFCFDLFRFEGGEVVLAEDSVGRKLHGRQIERLPNMPNEMVNQRVRGRRIENPVPVGATDTGEPSVEVICCKCPSRTVMWGANMRLRARVSAKASTWVASASKLTTWPGHALPSVRPAQVVGVGRRRTVARAASRSS